MTLPCRRRVDARLIHACEQLANGAIVIDAGSDREELTRQLESLPGIGPWTAGYVALRALGDPDVFLPTDIGVRNALRSIGVDVDTEGGGRARRIVAAVAFVCIAPSLGISVMKENEMFHTITIDSPVGTLRLIAGERGLRAILWGAEDVARIASIDEADLVEGSTPVLDAAATQLG